LYLEALKAKKMAAKSSASNAITPITIPATAPLDIPDLLLVSKALDEDEDEGDGKDDDEEEEDVEAEDEAVAETEELDDNPTARKICGSVTTPIPLVQQSLLSPQHHLPLSFLPAAHGVSGVFPNEPLYAPHMFKQFPLAMSRSVQKSNHHLRAEVNIIQCISLPANTNVRNIHSAILHNTVLTKTIGQAFILGKSIRCIAAWRIRTINTATNRRQSWI